MVIYLVLLRKTLDNITDFTEKNKIPFSSVKHLVADRHLYLAFENNEKVEINSACDFVNGVLPWDNINDSEVTQEIDDNRAKLKDNSMEGKFVSKNFIDLLQRQLTNSENLLFSKRLKFLPTFKFFYFFDKDPKFSRFCLPSKKYKRLHSVPNRPVISNFGYYTEKLSSFLDYHLQPLIKKVESYIKDTNYFLKNLKELGSLPKNAIL